MVLNDMTLVCVLSLFALAIFCIVGLIAYSEEVYQEIQEQENRENKEKAKKQQYENEK